VARILIVSMLLLAGLACSHDKPAKIYSMRGVIVKIDIPGKSAAINAEKIEGWMEAMTMDYPVHDPKLLEGLKPGDHITASVHVPEDLNYWIDNISKQ
jgi:Cu/Ag efflux protein CusF